MKDDYNCGECDCVVFCDESWDENITRRENNEGDNSLHILIGGLSLLLLLAVSTIGIILTL